MTVPDADVLYDFDSDFHLPAAKACTLIERAATDDPVTTTLITDDDFAAFAVIFVPAVEDVVADVPDPPESADTVTGCLAPNPLTGA